MGADGYSGIKMDKNSETPLSKHNGVTHPVIDVPEKIFK
jgi:hypothetical protein